jgi:hypothetical protein
VGNALLVVSDMNNELRNVHGARSCWGGCQSKG